jgi:hypothetical protein
MIAISLTISLLCASLATALFIDSYKNRTGLYRRIAGMAPGAPLNNSLTRIKRVRNLAKSSVMNLESELIELVEL